MSSEKYVVYDLDGTLSSSAWRTRLVDSPPRLWDVCFLLAPFDSPVPNTVEMLRQDRLSGHQIVVVTGRPQKFESQVVSWLANNRVDIDELRMRQDDDFRPDEAVKAEIADVLIARSGRPKKVVDDRRELDDVWASRGIRLVRVSDPILKPDEEGIRVALSRIP